LVRRRFRGTSLRQAYASSAVVVSGSATVDNTGNSIYFSPSYGSNVVIDNVVAIKMSGYALELRFRLDLIIGDDSNNPNGPVITASNGNLSGEAEVINDGSYINFSSTGADVVVSSSGVFSGYAWSLDLGWINFSGVTASGYNPDFTPPPINASSIQMYFSNGGTQVSNNGWISNDPYFTWTAGTDNTGGSGILGYCLYLGQDPTGNPITTKGDWVPARLIPVGACQFAVNANNVDTSIADYIGTALTTSSSPYYLMSRP